VHKFDTKKKVGEEERRIYRLLDALIPDQKGIGRNGGGGSAVSHGYQSSSYTCLNCDWRHPLLRVHSNDDIPGINVISSSVLTAVQMKDAIDRADQ
jgi:hypothetical protein